MPPASDQSHKNTGCRNAASSLLLLPSFFLPTGNDILYIPCMTMNQQNGPTPPPPPPQKNCVSEVSERRGDFMRNTAEIFSFDPNPTRAKNAWSSSTCLLYGSPLRAPQYCRIEATLANRMWIVLWKQPLAGGRHRLVLRIKQTCENPSTEVHLEITFTIFSCYFPVCALCVL